MSDFKRSGGFGGRQSRGNFGGNRGGDFGKRRSEGNFRSGGNPSPIKFKTVCAECGEPCEVPFKPSGDRPVYCSNCFKNRENVRPDRAKSYPSNPSNQSNSNVGDQLRKLSEKVDQILEILLSITIEDDEDEDAESMAEEKMPPVIKSVPMKGAVEKSSAKKPAVKKSPVKKSSVKKSPVKKGKKK